MESSGDEGEPTDLLFGKVSNESIEDLIPTRNRQNLDRFHAFITDQQGFLFKSNGKFSDHSNYGKQRSELYDLFVSRESWIDEHSLNFERGIKSRGASHFSKVNNCSFSFIQYVNPTLRPCFISDQLSVYAVENVAATAEENIASRVIVTFDRLIPRFEICKSIKLGVADGIFKNINLNHIIDDHPLVAALHTRMAPDNSGLALGRYVKRFKSNG